MDLIANYQAPVNERVIRWLPYASILADNTWTIESIAVDYRNPGILDPGEQMTIAIRLDPRAVTGSNRWIVLTTETGVSYSVYF